jgi:prevent-host-death family protein
MNTVSVGALRQNPTAALNAVADGETVIVTKHNRPIADLVPHSRPDDAVDAVEMSAREKSATETIARLRLLHALDDTPIVAPRRNGPSNTRALTRIELTTSPSLERLLDEEKGAW